MRTLLQNIQNNDSKVLDLMIKELGAKFISRFSKRITFLFTKMCRYQSKE